MIEAIIWLLSKIKVILDIVQEVNFSTESKA